ncbi:MAG: aldo/keto reductase [Xanthobacteraceae bacterium]|nr:aldo/keto reductase [Xanthobacteraceae bacterium]
MQIIETHGARIPAVGLGTWQISGRAGQRVIEQALRLGYRHIDTAQAYENEREVGEALRASGVKRNDVFVTTKIWHTHLAPNDLERSVKDSLARLRLSEADLLLIHWPNPQVPLSETLGALCKMKSTGYTRHIGVSNFTVALLEEAVKHTSEPIVVNQIEWHPYLDQSKVTAACRRHGIAVTAYSPIARGKTVGDDVLARIGKTYGKSEGQVSLRWLVQQGAIVIPRTSKVERLSENMDIFDFALSAEEMEEIRGLARPDGRVVNVAWAPNWDS